MERGSASTLPPVPVTLDELLRPVSTERLPVGGDGVTRIRNTRILAADIAFELGPERRSNDEVLALHAELDADDLDAVRAHNHAPLNFDVLIERVVGPMPSHDDVLAAYLFLPRVFRGYRVRSSFEAAYTDADNARGSWIGAIGDLVWLDQIGTALTRTNRTSSAPTSLERALELFSPGRSVKQRAALYALRNALAHDFSLVNPRNGNTPRDIALRHSFNLEFEADGPLIRFPRKPWDGDWNAFNPTGVNLARLATVTAKMRDTIYRCYRQGTLQLALAPEIARRRFIFTHGPLPEEVMQQVQADDAARWRRPRT